MRSTLYKFFLVPALTAAAALIAPSAKAATVNVPFNFVAQGHSFPAGSYSVQRDLNSNFVTLSAKDGAYKSITSVLGPGAPDNRDARIILRFMPDGNNYTLDTIQFGAKITSHMPQSKHTRESAPRVVVVGE